MATRNWPAVDKALLAQDDVSGLFAERGLGSFPGTLSLNLDGAAVTPRPAITVNFRSFDTCCGKPLPCRVDVADTGLQQGHGGTGRVITAAMPGGAMPEVRHAGGAPCRRGKGRSTVSAPADNGLPTVPACRARQCPQLILSAARGGDEVHALHPN
jgi:hypothetical protein